MIDTRVLAVHHSQAAGDHSRQCAGDDRQPPCSSGWCNPADAIIMVQDYRNIISIARTWLRDVVGQGTLNRLFAERERILSNRSEVGIDTKGSGARSHGPADPGRGRARGAIGGGADKTSADVRSGHDSRGGDEEASATLPAHPDDEPKFRAVCRFATCNPMTPWTNGLRRRGSSVPVADGRSRQADRTGGISRRGVPAGTTR